MTEVQSILLVVALIFGLGASVVSMRGRGVIANEMSLYFAFRCAPRPMWVCWRKKKYLYWCHCG